MAKPWGLLAGLCLGLYVGAGAGVMGAGAGAQAPAASGGPTKSCTVNNAAPSAAETALNRGDVSKAEGMLRDDLAKNPGNEAEHEALVRAEIDQDKVDAAAQDAEAWAGAAPASAMAKVALGEVRYRQGEMHDALAEFQKAAALDPCTARAYFGMAMVEDLAGFFASGRRNIERAYALHPTDDDIHVTWMSTRSRKEWLELRAEYLDKSDQVSDENREKMKAALAKAAQNHATDCRMAPGSPRTAEVSMVKATYDTTRPRPWGLDVEFNGKKRRLELDTGASGITISRAAAMFLGIDRQDEAKAGGIGDSKLVRTSIAHVASVKIGGIEFQNCSVEILEKWSVLDSDGLIGGDVFRNSVLTLDFPKGQLKIEPLPARPQESEEEREKREEQEDAPPPVYDPYVAPEMANWQRVYRSGHELLMPTGIVETKRASDSLAWKEKLFLLDTGSESNLISPASAREVTKIARTGMVGITGLQGEVAKVYDAGKFTLVFAKLRLDSPSMTGIDLTGISHDAGVEVSGVIGQPTLYQLVLHIDYRDNLVWCEHAQKK